MSTEAPQAPVRDLSSEPSPPARVPSDNRVRALRRFAVSITVFNIAGHLFLGFEQAPIVPVVTVLVSYTTALLFEALDSWASGRRAEYRDGLVTFLLAPHITALACAMLLWG